MLLLHVPLHNTDASVVDRFHRTSDELPLSSVRVQWSSVNSSWVHSVDSFLGNGRNQSDDRVADCSSPYLFGSHLDAEIIKVEPTGGDPLQVWRELDVDGIGPWFWSLHREEQKERGN